MLGVAALSVLIAAPGCTSRAHRGAQQSDAQIARSEGRAVDGAIAHAANASSVVDSYHIDDEVLTVVVVRERWDALRGRGQDALKRALWRPWHDAYEQNDRSPSQRVFVKIEDQQGNDLGSYFQ